MFDVKLIDVTPAMAAELLQHNTHNRPQRGRVVDAYAADMESGNWQPNGESVKIAEDGTLLDGQHRLAAIVKSGVTVPMLIVYGLPASYQDTIDGGAKRRFSDVLLLRGETQATTLASVVRNVTLWDSGTRANWSSLRAPTNAEMFQTLGKYPWLRETSVRAADLSRHCGLPASLAGLCMWVFDQIDAEDSAEFFDRLRDGQALCKGDPMYELRESLTRSRSVRGERSQRYLVAITIKAWNAYRRGRPVGVLTYKPGGAHPETFPVPE
jgi:hypothetical protein